MFPPPPFTLQTPSTRSTKVKDASRCCKSTRCTATPGDHVSARAKPAASGAPGAGKRKKLHNEGHVLHAADLACFSAASRAQGDQGKASVKSVPRNSTWRHDVFCLGCPIAGLSHSAMPSTPRSGRTSGRPWMAGALRCQWHCRAVTFGFSRWESKRSEFSGPGNRSRLPEAPPTQTGDRRSPVPVGLLFPHQPCA